MRSRILHFIICACALNIGAAHANWQYSGEYTYDMSPYDNGERATVSLRGGMTDAMAKMKNEVGSIVNTFCVNPSTGEVILLEGNSCSEYAGFQDAGTGNYGDLKASDLSGVAFSGGASIGWILPDKPQWRLELGWDHFSEMDYNESPMFSGDMKLSGGGTVSVESGAIQSTISSDIISAMAYYDFFDGLQKPMRKAIPYIGFGFGYADVETVLNLSDPWGDLSQVEDLTNFGTVNDNGVIQFYRSKTNTSTVAGIAALGFSYGLNKYLFFDFGARLSYIPNVKYRLVNSDDTRRMDLFSAKNLFYANVMLGIRFEF